jgi:hypothetical protein
MTPKTPRETPRDLPGAKPRSDNEHDTREASVEDGGDTKDGGRDLVHGDGGTIDLPTKPDDLSRDD